MISVFKSGVDNMVKLKRRRKLIIVKLFSKFQHVFNQVDKMERDGYMKLNDLNCDCQSCQFTQSHSLRNTHKFVKKEDPCVQDVGTRRILKLWW